MDKTGSRRASDASNDRNPDVRASSASSLRIIPVETGVARESELAAVGQPIPRIDGPMKVTGLQQYGADWNIPGMLFLKTVRSPHPHARVLEIDGSNASRLAGVRAVITAADIRGINRHGSAGPNRPSLIPVADNVRAIGDPVALVAAETLEAAEEASQQVRVDYEILPAVFDPLQALGPGAPILNYDRPDNIVGEYLLERGDVDKALVDADVVIDQVYHVPSQEHVQLETEAGVATIDPEGNLTIYAACQDPFYILQMISQALGVPEHRIRIVSLAAGGSFGVKSHVNVQVHLALGALVTRCPVKLVWTREESILAHPKRHPARIHYRLGATREGKFTALDVDVLADSGAYPTSSKWVLDVMCGSIPGPYDFPNIRVRGQAVATNNPMSGTFRGYGDPQGMTPTELSIERLAHQLELDPVALRLKNGHTQHSKPTQHGVHIDHPVMLGETVREALGIAGPKPQPSRPGVRVGRGLACIMPSFDVAGGAWGPMAGTGASVAILPDGGISVRCGVSEIGVGITTVLAQIASEELGVDIKDIQVVFGDTLTSPKAGPSVASRQAYTAGNAVRGACLELRRRMSEAAASLLQVQAEELSRAWGVFVVAAHPSRRVTLRGLAAHMYATGVDPEAHYWFRATHAEYGHLYMTALVDVEVDTETGQIELVQIVNSHDTGKALNPLNVRGQLIGGGNQALGWVLLENFQVQDGRILSPSLAEYLTPTSLDIPQSYKTVILEAPYPTGPYGAKGVGEHGMDSVPAAILNAIYDATGIAMTEWPVTPERMWRALKEKESHVHLSG